MPQTFGTAWIHGISGTITSAVVTDFSLDESLANVIEVVNESGNLVTRRVDDTTKEGSITLHHINGFVVATAGTTLSFNSVTYEVTRVGRRQAGRSMQAIEYGIRTSANITL